MKLERSGILSVGSDVAIPPSLDEIEISVFGPGYGECIVLHVGENNWIIVDSCVDSNLREPAPLAYLKKIAIDPASAVRLLVATHWQDDHIRGIGEVLEACRTAEFVCSDALKCDEFLTLARAYSRRAMQESSGIQEFNHIIEVLRGRHKSMKSSHTPKFAVADRILWRKPSNSSGGSPIPCCIKALSPVDAAILAGKLDIARLLPHEKEPKRRLPALTPNRAAVVLWVEIGGLNILLGSDLEETNVSTMGWSVIVQSLTRPLEKAGFFKVPHHGSANAHHGEVWSEMLQPEPVAVLTPFHRGAVVLPTLADMDRITRFSPHGFITANPGLGHTKKRHPTVEKMIKEVVGVIRPVHPFTGHVRLRVRPPELAKIELFGNAQHLQTLLKNTNG
jgi:hypothetical protein